MTLDEAIAVVLTLDNGWSDELVKAAREIISERANQAAKQWAAPIPHSVKFKVLNKDFEPWEKGQKPI